MSNSDNRLTVHPDAIDTIREELKRRETILIQMAENTPELMNKTDRDNIIKYLRDKYIPVRPNTIPDLMKNFVSSGLSYSVTRKWLKAFIGKFPEYDTIALAISKALADDAFLQDDNWRPQRLVFVVGQVCDRRGLQDNDLYKKEMIPRALGLMKDGAAWFDTALADGLNAYYADIESQLASPESAWSYLTEFSRPIRHLAEALASDYMKNIGFHQFVKPDVHLLRELPDLTGLSETMKPRELFVFAWHLSRALGVTAFYLDHLLYQWGRNGRREEGTYATPQKKSTSRTLRHSPTTSKTLPDSTVKPEAIWRRCYPGQSLEEIKQVNPFATKAWLKDTATLSETRLRPIRAFFRGRDMISKADIKRLKPNEGCYAAFRAIAHGIAVWDFENDRLVKKT